MKIKLMMITLFMCLLTFYSCEKDPISSPINNNVSNCALVQCYSIAKSTGYRCKNKTTNCNGKCYQHQ